MEGVTTPDGLHQERKRGGWQPGQSGCPEKMWKPGESGSPQNVWQPGQSGNPSGRPKGVTYPGDWVRGLMDKTRAELQAIADDPATTAPRVIAAYQLLDAMHPSDARLRGVAAERVMDRTEGKPTQQVEVKQADTRSVAERLADLQEKVGVVTGGAPQIEGTDNNTEKSNA